VNLKFNFLVRQCAARLWYDIPTGQVPLDPRITQCTESGKSFVDNYKGTPTQQAMTNITKQLISLCNCNNN